MDFVSAGWLWIYAGLALVLLELVTPGFILCFFGLSAMTVGFVRLLVGEAFDATWCAGAFSILAVLYIVLLRRALKKVFMGEKDAASRGLSDDFAGRAGTVVEAIVPPKEGRVLVGDAEWTAVADAPLAAGADVVVVSQKNLTLKVKGL